LLKVAKKMSDLLTVGDLIITRFPSQNPQGREQEGIRPALIVGFPHNIGVPRFPLIFVAPLTTYLRQSWAIASLDLYPKLSRGQGNLPRNSIILLDQIRAIDLSRIDRYLGTLTTEEYQPIFSSIQKMLLFDFSQP
jgi:mRNA interferase MazF